MRVLRMIGMLAFGFITTALTAAGQTQAPIPPSLVQARSHSGQFIVQRVAAPLEVRSRAYSNFVTNRNYITLEPTLLPVSCERIKQTLQRLLGVSTTWEGRIYLALYAAHSGEDPITIDATRFRDGWQYRLELPDLLDRSRYVRSVLDVVLLELSNRSATERSAEIPAWLAEGLCQEVLASAEIQILLPPPKPGSGGGLSYTATVVQSRQENALAAAHGVLSANPALTFQQLSWPGPEQLEGASGEVFRSSAHLFVNQLLRLPNGGANLAAMIADLPRHYNWQFAFLQAFRGQFQRPLDVEKWWALHVEHFTGRELTQTWPPNESWEKFNALVHPAVQVFASTKDLPLSTEVKLQTIIREWDKTRQVAALQSKVRELEHLRLRLFPTFAPLADQYHYALATYLTERDNAVLPFRRKAVQRYAAEEAIKELDRLDAVLAGMRPVSAQAKVK